MALEGRPYTELASIPGIAKEPPAVLQCVNCGCIAVHPVAIGVCSAACLKALLDAGWKVQQGVSQEQRDYLLSEVDAMYEETPNAPA